MYTKMSLHRIASLRETLDLISEFQECMFFPLETGIRYYKPESENQLYIKNTLLKLKFKDHSLQNLKKLARQIGLKYEIGITKPQLVALLETRVIPYSTLKEQIEKQLELEKKAYADYVEKQEQQKRRIEEERALRRQSFIDDFYKTFKPEIMAERYADYMELEFNENKSINLDDFNLCVNDAVIEELKTSPETYKFLHQARDKYLEALKEVEILEKILERVKTGEYHWRN